LLAFTESMGPADGKAIASRKLAPNRHIGAMQRALGGLAAGILGAPRSRVWAAPMRRRVALEWARAAATRVWAAPKRMRDAAT